MESEKANQIPLEEILEKYGCKKVKSYAAGYDMYHSPFREEKDPSFKVNLTTNRWQDFGEGTFGSAVDLVMRIEKCSFVEAMQVFEQNRFAGIRMPDEVPRGQQPEYAQQANLHILKVSPLKNKILLNYIKSRGIDSEIAQKHCEEIYYKIGERGKNCFAVGFKNDSGGFEIRNPMFKGCNSKDITCISNGSNRCAVFEGFFDMLSYLQLMKYKPVLQQINLVVLNTTALLPKAEGFIQKHETIHSFLDNDPSGRCAFRELQKMGKEVVNESLFLYPQCKDLNEYLQNSLKEKIEGQPSYQIREKENIISKTKLRLQ